MGGREGHPNDYMEDGRWKGEPVAKWSSGRKGGRRTAAGGELVGKAVGWHKR